MIDAYSRQARLVPVLITALPLVLGGSVALSRLTVIERVVVLALLVALLPLFDQLGRLRGRRREPALFAAWGGQPTTQLLRWRGPASPAVQQFRHQAVERVTALALPAPDDERADPAAADQAYAAAVRTLRVLTADSPAVQAENRHYGFRRNLLGLRWWGCLAAGTSLAAAVARAVLAWPEPARLWAPGALAGVDLALLALWLGVVREPWVREAAWSYAERLLGQAELLGGQPGPAGRAGQAGQTGQTAGARPAGAAAGRADAAQQAPPPTIAVLTALACEHAAVTAVLRQATPVTWAPAGDPNLYLAGQLPSRDPRAPHQVVATVLPFAGNRSAAAAVTDALRSFPTIRCVIFCGIAGGVPGPPHSAAEITLGDVLVAVDGVVDYGNTQVVDGQERLRRQLAGLSADMLRAVQDLRATHPDPAAPLAQELERVTDPRFARPGQPGTPRVHFGAIGSAEHLVRDAARRDQLARAYGIRGIEMEASGLAVGASLRGVPWFVVRGIADYCDNRKDDTWQCYAALTAAAFVAVLLRHARPLGTDTPADPAGL